MPLVPHRLLPGADRSPVLLHVPHAGLEIPAWTRRHLLLDDVELAAEVAGLTDHHTDAIAAAAADLTRIRPWTVVNRVSRFVVDPERLPDEREEMAAVGMAAVYTHGTRRQRLRDEDPAHRDALLAAFFVPWAALVQGVVAERLAATGRAVLLDVHSYPRVALPYERHADGARPAVCLGSDPGHTPSWLLDAAREAFAPVGDIAVERRSRAPTCRSPTSATGGCPRSWWRSAATSTSRSPTSRSRTASRRWRGPSPRSSTQHRAERDPRPLRWWRAATLPTVVDVDALRTTLSRRRHVDFCRTCAAL